MKNPCAPTKATKPASTGRLHPRLTSMRSACWISLYHHNCLKSVLRAEGHKNITRNGTGWGEPTAGAQHMGNFLLTAIACCTSKNMSTHLIVPVNIQRKITPQSFDKGPDTLRRRVLSRGCCLPATDRPAPRPRVPAGQSSSLSPARPGQVRSGQARPRSPPLPPLLPSADPVPPR